MPETVGAAEAVRFAKTTRKTGRSELRTPRRTLASDLAYEPWLSAALLNT